MATGAVDILVIGIGNEQRGDDAAGLLVARRLRDRGLPGVAVVEAQCDATLLIDLWAGAEKVYLVDAVVSGAPPGSLFRLDGLRQDSEETHGYRSSHGLGVKAAIELARALDRLPQHLVIYGIEGAGFAVGAAISPEAQGGVAAAVAAIVADLGGEGKRNHA